jgi:hypothetical protein
LTDYFATSEEEEDLRRVELLRLKQEKHMVDEAPCHYDTPLTDERDAKALNDVGFSTANAFRD